MERDWVAGPYSRRRIARSHPRALGASPTRRRTRILPQRAPIGLIVSLAVACCLLLLLTSIFPDPDKLFPPPQNSERFRSALSTNPAAAAEFPYVVAPALYPAPSNFSSSSVPSLVRLAATPTGTNYLLFVNDSSRELWLAPSSYSAADAKALALGLKCISGTGPSCLVTQSVYETWNRPTLLYTAGSSTTIVADASGSTGSTLVIAATTSGTTHVWATVNGGGSLTALGNVSGTVTGLSASPQSALVTTVVSGALAAAILSLNGGVVSTDTLASSGIQNASAAWVFTPAGGTDAVVVASDSATSSVYRYVSSNDGQSFSTATKIATLNETAPSAIFNSVGGTRLVPPGGWVGQVAATATGSGVFVLYTNRIGGRILAETEVSSNSGTSWQGPFVAATPSGSVQDPSITTSPDGDVVATWRDSGNGTWQVDQAIFSADGVLRAPVAPLPASGGDAAGVAAPGAPAVAADWLNRPLYAWPSVPSSGTPQIDYSGDFLSAKNALQVLDTLATDPLQPADFAPPSSSSVSSFVTRVSAAVSATSTDLGLAQGNSLKALEAAQNETLNVTLPNVTHVMLSVSGWVNHPKASVSLLADTFGVFAPNIYLAVLAADLVNSLAGSVGASPLQGVTTYGTYGGAIPVRAFAATSAIVDGQSANVSITPTPQSPVVVQLSALGMYPEYTKYASGECELNGQPVKTTFTYYSEAVKWWSNVTLSGIDSGDFSSTVSLPSIYLTNLTPLTNFSWSGTFTGMYAEYVHWDACNENVTQSVTPDTLGPLATSLTISGWTVTTLAVFPGQPYMLQGKWPNAQTPPSTLTASWNNSMLAADSLWINTTAGTLAESWTDSQYVISDTATFPGIALGNYTAQVAAQSEPGAYVSADRPAISYGSTFSYPPQEAGSSCTFALVRPTFAVWVNSNSDVGNLTTSTARIQWEGNVSGLGTITYYDSDTGENYTISGVPAVKNTTLSNGTYDYVVVLHALDDFATYGVQVGVGVGSGCLESILVRSFTFQTPSVVSVWENDEPYDSITGTGGGATIWWVVPEHFVAAKPVFDSGVVYWENSSATVQEPLTNASEFGGTGSTIGTLNLTLPQQNITYSVWLDLNYTVGGEALDITSTPATFDYLRDSSGDGLTDLEKGLGWTVTYTTSSGGIVNQLVTADPSDYATNGLVSDYLEKEYDLNPNTVDSAGSHMLDTWNLTFDLGLVTSSPKLPSTPLFEYWYENATYDPFGTGSPSAQNQSTGIAANPTGGRTSGDGSAAASKILWSLGELDAFENLSGVKAAGWLRAVTGTWKGVRTLTVEGKLSWGANPLAASTSGTGVPDGAQVDPLGGTDLQVTITGWTDTAKASGNGVAVFIYANSSATAYSSAKVDYSAYTRQVTAGSSGAASFPNATSPKTFVVTFPVTASEQFAYLNLSLVQNESTSSSSDTVYAISSTTQYKVDLTNDALQSVTYPSGGGNPSLSFTYHVLPVYARAPTWFLAPANNSTLSPLPAGLSRYTAEQDFDLLVLNDTAPAGSTPTKIAVGSILGPQLNWSYTMSLLPGLNNILVPRSLFLASPLGETLINATTTVTISSKHQDSALTFNPGNWISRVLNTSSNRPSSTSFISVFSSTTQSGSSGVFGGVASNPAIEVGYESRQVQAVFWINVSSAGYGSNLTSGSAELTDLLGGLLLNSTGNLTGNLLNETAELPTLGLSSNVLAALANGTYRNDGAYGTPVSTSKGPLPPTPWWDVVAADIWNAVSGVVNVVAKIVSVVWNSVVAAASYLADAAAALSARLGITALLSQTLSALRAVGNAMWTALDDLLNDVIIPVIKAAISVVVYPITNGASSFDSTLAAAGNVSIRDVNNNGSVSPTDGLAWAHCFDWIAVLGDGIGIALLVALTLLLPLDLGGSFLMTLLLAVLPDITQKVVPGFAAITSLTAQAVLTFANAFPGISKVIWEAIAGSVAVAAASSDFAWANVALAIRGAVSGVAAFAVIVSIIVDMVVITVSVDHWAASLPVLAGTALGFAAIGLGTALVTHSSVYAQLGTYADVAVLLATIAAGAAVWDYILAT